MVLVKFTWYPSFRFALLAFRRTYQIMSIRIAILVLSLSVTCGVAYADTISATGVDPNRSETIWMAEKGTPAQGIAGVISIDLTTTGGDVYHRDTLCVDLFVSIYLGQTYNTNVLSPAEVSGKDHLGIVSWLIDNALLPSQSSFASVLPPADWVTTPAQGAGIQLAIWDLVEDDGDGLSSGNVQISTAAGEATEQDVADWANTYESLAVGHLAQPSDDAYVYVNTDFNGHGAQMLEGPQFQDGGPEPAPEPSTFALGGGGLVAAGLVTYRSRKAVPAS
jgi:PEP-CTERM motif